LDTITSKVTYNLPLSTNEVIQIRNMNSESIGLYKQARWQKSPRIKVVANVYLDTKKKILFLPKNENNDIYLIMAVIFSSS
jgi:hypothetical protein